MVNDFNGNGGSDLAVFRPSAGQWFINGVSNPFFGLPGDIPVSADYDGNGVADVAVFRPATGQWFVSGGVPGTILFGRSGDVPVPADYDGDTRTDIAVYRTTDSNVGVWYFNVPGQNPVAWGLRGDIPMPGDYDGDGRADVAVYRPANSTRYIAYAAAGFSTSSSTSFGLTGDIPVRADLDNDRKLDFVVFRPSTGTWFMVPHELRAGFLAVRACPATCRLGSNLDGDGSSELCVWRPASGTWFIRNRVAATTTMTQFGLAGDIPLGARPQVSRVAVADFDADGVSDITVFRPASGTWFTRFSASGFAEHLVDAVRLERRRPGQRRLRRRLSQRHGRLPARQRAVVHPAVLDGDRAHCQWGLAGDLPAPVDYYGDGLMDVAIYRPSAGQWFLTFSSGGGAVVNFGLSSDIPVAADYDGDGRADCAVYRPSSGHWHLRLSSGAFGGDHRPAVGPVG